MLDISQLSATIRKLQELEFAQKQQREEMAETMSELSEVQSRIAAIQLSINNNDNEITCLEAELKVIMSYLVKV